MSVLPRMMYRADVIPIKIPTDFLQKRIKIDKVIINFIWKYKEPRIAKVTLKKIYDKTTIIQTVWY